MQGLNLPTYKSKIKSKENKLFIFDTLRKKYVVLTPEEWVRQHFINYLIVEKKYPPTLIAVEKKLVLNGLTKRTDILVFNAEGTHEIIVECKAPNIEITQDTFDQIARYNLNLNAKYLAVTNGMQHFYCKINHTKKKYDFLPTLPIYNT
ncbi:MAG TPA: type I restriction enzyme HsdR N-terminal domain-containing protein [Flavobacteriaceae bacterium]|nr:type I restriction enzyme HsdR N-terminal domain-containing protein [Flavobacteriaceae bacterium]